MCLLSWELGKTCCMGGKEGDQDEGGQGETGLSVSAHVAFVWVDLETSEALLVLVGVSSTALPYPLGLIGGLNFLQKGRYGVLAQGGAGKKQRRGNSSGFLGVATCISHPLISFALDVTDTLAR